MIYLDNNATTQIDPAALEEMLPFLRELYGNPSSGYQFASKARRAIEQGRERLAALLGCKPAEIVFTSGGTEANNAALNSALEFDPRGKHVITTAVEHSAVRRHGEELAKRGAEVTFLTVATDGQLDFAEFEKAIRPNTAVVSAMWANNETGVLFPVEKMAAICRERGIFFHTDAVQVIGKIPVKLRDTGINFLSLSAHKFHGPKGVGALYVSERTRFTPSAIGGSHEGGRRAGTENVAGIVGMGKAAERAAECLSEEHDRVGAMREKFEATLTGQVEDVTINGAGANRLTNTTNASFGGLESQALLLLLDREGICCSAGSACKTGSHDTSHVLKAMQVPEEKARGTARFSFGRFNTEEDLEVACRVVPQVIAKLRGLRSPSVVASV